MLYEWGQCGFWRGVKVSHWEKKLPIKSTFQKRPLLDESEEEKEEEEEVKQKEELWMKKDVLLFEEMVELVTFISGLIKKVEIWERRGHLHNLVVLYLGNRGAQVWAGSFVVLSEICVFQLCSCFFFSTKKPLLLNIKRFQQPQYTQLHPVDLNCMNKESKHIQ